MKNPPRAKKSLGQNFLTDPNYQRKILSCVDACLDDIFPEKTQRTILEIGPGRGALTKELLRRSESLTLVEKDDELVDQISQDFAGEVKIHIHTADFLRWPVEKHITTPHLVVANLPYNVASQILFRLFEFPQLFPRYLLMFQKEVALRCVAAPGTKDYGLLSVWCQVFSVPRILFYLPPGAFRPRPRVQSSFVEFQVRGANPQAERPFILFVKKIFAQRRKQLGTVLRQMISAEMLGLLREPEKSWLEKRAETLSISELRQLYQSVEK